MTGLDEVLVAFHEATGCDAAVWQRSGEGKPVSRVAGHATFVLANEDDLPNDYSLDLHNDGSFIRVRAPHPSWIQFAPCNIEGDALARHVEMLRLVVSHLLQSSSEVEHAANELAERYEEINLLYSISEILGRTVSLNEGAKTILREVSETVGARRSSILIFDTATNMLNEIARIGNNNAAFVPIPASDASSVSAHVFRTLAPIIVNDGEMECPGEQVFRSGAMLTVPILWSTRAGTEPLGVVNLSDRASGHPFTAGDLKLVTAIASQVGAAIQNARLVRRSLDEQRLRQEMQLAHDLQMKLLPDVSHVAPEAIVSARVVPAEDVGGDFYNLYRLSNDRTGVMIGDVSGHGYQAALIMALTMSASAIHAQDAATPSEMLRRLHISVREELNTTEMFVSAFYAVIDRSGGQVRYANMGHPHAFIIRGSGDVERLLAGGPPLGMLDEAPDTQATDWDPATDLLVLLTDGITDARNAAGTRLDEAPVLDCIRKFRHEAPGQIVDRVFELLDEYTGDIAPKDDLTLLVLKSQAA